MVGPLTTGVSSPSALSTLSSSTASVTCSTSGAGIVIRSRPSQKLAKDWSKVVMSSGRRTRVARPAQYTPARSVSPTAPNASVKASTLPRGTISPAPRSTLANATAIRPGWSPTPFGSGPVEWGPHQLADAVSPDPFLILAVFENGAQGDVDGAFVQR